MWKRPRSTQRQAYFELLLLQGLLQHYGFQTVCLDLTADPRVALWFALHSQKRLLPAEVGVRLTTYVTSDEPYGVVYVLEIPKPQIGRDRQVVPNVLTADLAVEIPHDNWRPRRQSALSISQQEWGVRPGDMFNRLAGCIRKRLVVPRELVTQVHESMRGVLTLDWLFPPCTEDALYRRVATEPILPDGISPMPDWIIYPDHVGTLPAGADRNLFKEYFLNQATNARPA